MSFIRTNVPTVVICLELLQVIKTGALFSSARYCREINLLLFISYLLRFVSGESALIFFMLRYAVFSYLFLFNLDLLIYYIALLPGTE